MAEIEILRLQANDTLIVRCGIRMQEEQAQRMKELIKKELPRAARVLVIGPDVTISIVRPE